MVWLTVTNIALNLLLGAMTLFFILRIVLTWYPQTELNKLPFSLIAIPTEPLLAPTRKLVPPLGGIDVSPVIWVGIVTFLREILLGQQGLLLMLMR